MAVDKRVRPSQAASDSILMGQLNPPLIHESACFFLVCLAVFIYFINLMDLCKPIDLGQGVRCLFDLDLVIASPSQQCQVVVTHEEVL